MMARKEGAKTHGRKHENFFVKHEDILESEMMRQVQNGSYS